MDKWKNSKNNPPQTSLLFMPLLVYSKGWQQPDYYFYQSGKWFTRYMHRVSVPDYWMYLPQVPKEE